MKSRWQLPIVIVAALIVGGYFFLAYLDTRQYIPPEFSEARLKGAELAKKIVELSGDSLANLEQIAEYDKQGNAPEALILISKEVIKNRETHEGAIRLSSQLERMARTVSDIKPAKARILATEAVSSEVALVSRLISYNDYLRQLFEILRDKFQSRGANPDGKVKGLIDKINEEARAINEFNQRFNGALAEFDNIFTQ